MQLFKHKLDRWTGELGYPAEREGKKSKFERAKIWCTDMRAQECTDLEDDFVSYAELNDVIVKWRLAREQTACRHVVVWYQTSLDHMQS